MVTKMVLIHTLSPQGASPVKGRLSPLVTSHEFLGICQHTLPSRHTHRGRHCPACKDEGGGGGGRAAGRQRMPVLCPVLWGAVCRGEEAAWSKKALWQKGLPAPLLQALRIKSLTWFSITLPCTQRLPNGIPPGLLCSSSVLSPLTPTHAHTCTVQAQLPQVGPGAPPPTLSSTLLGIWTRAGLGQSASRGTQLVLSKNNLSDASQRQSPPG